MVVDNATNRDSPPRKRQCRENAITARKKMRGTREIIVDLDNTNEGGEDETAITKRITQGMREDTHRSYTVSHHPLQ